MSGNDEKNSELKHTLEQDDQEWDTGTMSQDDYSEYEQYDDDDDEDYPSRPRPWWLRLVALVTILAFAGLVFATSWPADHLTIPDVLIKSLHTEKDLDVKRLEQAVVKVHSLSRQPGSLIAEQKSGTGFNIDARGVIITNHHVIANSINMTLTFPNGKTYKAVNWAGNPKVDLAVITLEARELPTIPVNYHERPVPGDKIKVVGNPLGLNNVVVDGKVERYYQIQDGTTEVFAIDAPVYPGNSGSPVFNREGQVVGVVFASLPQDDRGYPPGLAVPIKEVLQIQEQALENELTVNFDQTMWQ